MEPTAEAIEKTIQEFGYENLEEISEVEGIECDDEMAINLGYFYCNLYEVYFKKNNTLYSEENESVIEYLRGL